MKDNKPIIKKIKDYIEKTEYWGYEDGLVLGSDEAQQLIEALEQVEDMKKLIEVQKQYIEFLGKHVSLNAAFLFAHRIETSEADIQKGVSFRDKIHELEIATKALKEK